MKKVILFDIDYTLFDTAMFRERLFKAMILSLGHEEGDLSGKEVREVATEILSGVPFFQPKKFSTELAKRLGRPQDMKVIEKAVLAVENFEDILYKESLGVVEAMTKVGIVGIFSKGYTSFQKRKIQAIKYLFDKKHVHILVDKHKSLPEILRKYQNYKLYIIDDALDVLHTASLLSPDVATIWVKRGRYALKFTSIKGFRPSAQVTTLKDVVKIVNKL